MCLLQSIYQNHGYQALRLLHSHLHCSPHLHKKLIECVYRQTLVLLLRVQKTTHHHPSMEAKQTRMIRRVGWECGAEKDVVRRKKNDCEGENTRGNNHTWQKETVYDLWWDEALIKMQQNKIVACLHRIWVGDLAFLCNSHFEVTLLCKVLWQVNIT